MRVTKKRLRQMIREAMMSGPGATPGQAITTADDEKSASGFSPEQKAAIGFMNNSMGQSPSADQLKGMGPELQSYAKDKNVNPDKMRSHLQKMLPGTPAHPHFQYDAGSGSVGGGDGKKVYGENKMRVTRRQLRRIIKEEVAQLRETDGWYSEEYETMADRKYADRPDDLEARLNAVWDKVGADTMDALGGQATWEDIADEVMASGYSIDPDLIESINLLPFEEQQRLFQRTFGAGRRY